MKICIDAGHNYSSYDTGAMGNGLIEQEITFKVSHLLNNYLNYIGLSTIMTRTEMSVNLGYDTNSSLSKRCLIANNNNCDYFVSIHCNSHINPFSNGNEVLISGFGGEAEKLANCINKNICDNLPIKNRGVKQQNVKVLRNTNMPAVLVELGFISNKKDAELIKNNLEDFALCIFNGICEYLGVDNAMLKEKVYNYINEVPEWSLPTIQKLIDKGLLKGNDKGELGLNETMIKIFVVNDRAKLYD